jgi:hypothetical protein
MEILIVEEKELKKQIKAVLESDMKEDIKEGLHNLLGEILDYTEQGKLIKIDEDNGTEGQDRKSYTDTQDRKNYFVRR